MSPYRRSWRGLAGAVALALAACSDSNAPQPQLSNPQQLSSDLQTVSTIFEAPAFQSFAALEAVPGSPLGSAPAGALLAAARVAAPPALSAPYSQAPARLEAIKRAAAALSSASPAGVIPLELQGKTFEWSASTHAYVVGADAGPANGVRIILYAIDPITDQVVEPPVPVGYVELLDESAGSTNQLGVSVAGGTPASPGTTYLDYAISATVTGNPATAFGASAGGYVRDAARQLGFQATFTATNLTTDNPDGEFDTTWNLDNPAVSLALHEAVTTTDASHATLTADFSVTRGDETVGFAGTIAYDALLDAITADLTVYINGATYARITGTNQGIRARHADGTDLSAAEADALSSLFDLPDRLQEAVDHLFHPAEHLMDA